MSGLSAAANHVQLGPPTPRSICPIGAPKVRQLEKQLHNSNLVERRQIAFKFHKMVLCGFVEDAELSKLSQMANDAQIFNIRASISLEWLNLEISNLMCASTMSMHKTRSKRRYPVQVT